MMATRNDKVVWSFDSLGKFSSRSFGKEMENSSYSDLILHLVWKFKAPPKELQLCWQSIVDKPPTRYVLLRFSIIAENQAGCPLCNSCIESADHIFIHLWKRMITIKNGPPIVGSLKFNVDGAAKGKSRPAGIDRMVNEKLDLPASSIIIESDFLNALSWVWHPHERPCYDADKLAKEGVLRFVPLVIWNL
ncbi:reverse transcriptase [Tanacetum coccineum]